jgi:hypothetical protein
VAKHSVLLHRRASGLFRIALPDDDSRGELGARVKTARGDYNLRSTEYDTKEEGYNAKACIQDPVQYSCRYTVFW